MAIQRPQLATPTAQKTPEKTNINCPWHSSPSSPSLGTRAWVSTTPRPPFPPPRQPISPPALTGNSLQLSGHSRSDSRHGFRPVLVRHLSRQVTKIRRRQFSMAAVSGVSNCQVGLAPVQAAQWRGRVSEMGAEYGSRPRVHRVVL